MSGGFSTGRHRVVDARLGSRLKWTPKHLAIFGGTFVAVLAGGLSIVFGPLRNASPDPAPSPVSETLASPPLAKGHAPPRPVQQTSIGAKDQSRANFDFSTESYNCVVDGDTIWLEGQNIRVADIDAPETHDFRCMSEKELGDQSTRRLHELLESGPVTLQSLDRDEDSYGRKLRIVLVNGQSVGNTLVSEGLARWYRGGKRPWC